MRTAIYSDVHGNLPAFESFVKLTRSEADQYLNLGDLVNYGPWSNECVDLALSLPTLGNIMGNHEEIFLNPISIASELELVNLFFQTTFMSFNRFEEISTFQESINFGTFTAAHTIGSQRIYPDTKIKLDRNWLIGHTHHQFIYQNSGFKLVNPGSIGQNRTTIKRFEYAIYDDVENFFEFFSLDYSWESLIQKMVSIGYPEPCLDYYRSKL
jgi:hypothetical protein